MIGDDNDPKIQDQCTQVSRSGYSPQGMGECKSHFGTENLGDTWQIALQQARHTMKRCQWLVLSYVI